MFGETMSKKLQLGKRRLLGRRCWQLAMKKQTKDVPQHTEKKIKVKRCILLLFGEYLAAGSNPGAI